MTTPGIDQAGGRRKGDGDPTRNVRDLNASAMKRVDDLAALRKEIVEAQLTRLKRDQVWLEKIVTLRATQLDRMMNALTDRTAALEKSSYMGAGKQAVADPQMERLSQMVAQLVQAHSTDTGKHAGLSLGWSILLGGVGLVGSLLAIGGVLVTLVIFLTRAPQATPYTPAPSGTMLPTPSPPAVPR